MGRRDEVSYPFLVAKPMREAYPGVARVDVEVLEQTMAGPERHTSSFVVTPERWGIPGFVQCNNPCCTRRGVALTPRLSEALDGMVKNREVERVLKSAFCSGHESMGRGQRRDCLRGFTITVRVQFLPDT